VISKRTWHRGPRRNLDCYGELYKNGRDYICVTRVTTNNNYYYAVKVFRRIWKLYYLYRLYYHWLPRLWVMTNDDDNIYRYQALIIISVTILNKPTLLGLETPTRFSQFLVQNQLIRYNIIIATMLNTIFVRSMYLYQYYWRTNRIKTNVLSFILGVFSIFCYFFLHRRPGLVTNKILFEKKTYNKTHTHTHSNLRFRAQRRRF